MFKWKVYRMLSAFEGDRPLYLWWACHPYCGKTDQFAHHAECHGSRRWNKAFQYAYFMSAGEL